MTHSFKGLLYDCSSLFEQNTTEAGVCGQRESDSPHGIRKQRVEGLGIMFIFKDLPVTTYFLQMSHLLKSPGLPRQFHQLGSEFLAHEPTAVISPSNPKTLKVGQRMGREYKTSV